VYFNSVAEVHEQQGQGCILTVPLVGRIGICATKKDTIQTGANIYTEFLLSSAKERDLLKSGIGEELNAAPSTN
jgi:hypothetical protein